MNTCVKCNQEKEHTEFYFGDKTCKVCRRAMAKANREAKLDYYREKDKARANNPDRVAARKAYAKTEAGKAAHARATAKYRELNPIKRGVHVMVGNAIRDGKLVKQPCEVCGCKKVHAHHTDYANPLDVMWLCTEHHEQWHKENGEGANAS